MKELNVLHDKHLTRPAFDDSIDEEHAIEILTQEITQVNMINVTFMQDIYFRNFSDSLLSLSFLCPLQ